MNLHLQWHPTIRKRFFIGIAFLLLAATLLEVVVNTYSAPLFRASTVINHAGVIRALSQRLVLQALHYPANTTSLKPDKWNSPASLEQDLQSRVEEISQYLREAHDIPELDEARFVSNELQTLTKQYIAIIHRVREYRSAPSQKSDGSSARADAVQDSLIQEALRQSHIVLETADNLVQKTDVGFIALGYRSRILGVLSSVLLVVVVIVLGLMLMQTTVGYNQLYHEERTRGLYLNSLLDNAHLYVFRVNMQGQYTYLNKTFAEKFTPAHAISLLGSNAENILLPADRAAFRRVLEECRVCFTMPIKETLRMVSQSGTTRVCRWNCMAILDADGTVTEIQCAGEDISDYMTISEQEQTTKTNLQAVFDASIQAMWLLDNNLTVLSCNQLAASAVQAAFGRTPEIGDSIFAYILPEHKQEEVRENMHKALQGERISHEAEFHGHWFEYQYSPVYDEKRQVTGITLAALDITLLKNSIVQLEKQQHFLETILAAVPGGVYIYDTIHNANIYASPSISNVLGYTPAELQAMGENFLFHHVHEEDIPRIVEHLRAIESNPSNTEANIEYRFRHKDGMWIWLMSRDSAFARNQDGKILQFLGMVSDITQKKEAEMEILQLNEVLEYRVAERTQRLEDLNREKDEILSIAAHDLKNPIAGIRTGAEIIAMMVKKNEIERIEQYTRLTIEACETIVEIINNLLDVGKLESGTMQIALQPTSLQVLAQVIEANQEQALRKGIVIHNNIDTHLVVRADEKALRQVLDNLVSNAVKYSPHWKPIIVRTEIHNRNNTPFVRICVQDEGPGLSADDHTKLFRKFTRLSAMPTAGESSTGLGLSIVKKLVDLQEGRVWCESVMGEGATFCVELPMAEAE